jgi:hypothetical protein
LSLAQLTLYALAIAQLAWLKLFDIKCGWLNENEYYEFFPRKLFTGRTADSLVRLVSDRGLVIASTHAVLLRKSGTLSIGL